MRVRAWFMTGAVFFTVLGLFFCLVANAATSLDTGRFVTSMGYRPAVPPEGTQTVAIDVTPYSASYLPAKRGPLAKEKDCNYFPEIQNGFLGGACDLLNDRIKENACLSAAEKFDRSGENVTGRDPGLLEDYLRRGYRPDAEGWEGFCHNWAPAAMDPIAGLVTSVDRIYGEVPFGVGDLRELMTYVYPSPRSIFIGTRNYGDEPAERNLDAIDLHTIFTEFVGPDKPGVVFDIDAGTQVWNQPFYQYETTTKDATADPAVSGSIPPGGRALHVRLRGSYAVEGPYRYSGPLKSRTSAWSYYLVLDRRDRIVGARWDERAANDDIPDFAWVPDRKQTNAWFRHLEEIAENGIPINAIEEFCEAIVDATDDGVLSDAEKSALREQYRALAAVTDPNRVNDHIRETALAHNLDYSELSSVLMA